MRNRTGGSAPTDGEEMRVMQPSPAAYGGEPYIRHLDLWSAPVLSFPLVCRVPGLFLPSLVGSSAGTQG